MALAKLQQLYMAVVTDHAKNPHHYGSLADVEPVVLHNPSCGDVIQLSVKLVDDRVVDIAFTGHGCSISIASASMMTDVVVGKNRKEAEDLAEIFSQMLQGQSDDRQKTLGDASFLVGVTKFPQRIKCAGLAWQALTKCLANEKGEENV